jgi:hypothetical protein
MFLAMHGQPSEVDAFLFILAERLHKTVTEIVQLPAREIAEWQAYFKVKAQAEDLARKAAGGGC